MSDVFREEVADCLLRLPPENRFGVASIEPVAGSEVGADSDMGEPPLAVELEIRFDDGRVRHVPVRSRAWVNDYFDGKDRVDWCRSLLFPPDILVFTEPTVVVEQIAGHSLVRGVMCLLRHEQGCAAVF
jgi:hypothetical protein